jgi:hypothetical protein
MYLFNKHKLVRFDFQLAYQTSQDLKLFDLNLMNQEIKVKSTHIPFLIAITLHMNISYI